MDKLKKVFSPGSDKDDAILYGSEESRLPNTSDNATSRRDNDTLAAGQTDGLADHRTGTQAAQDQSGAHGPGRDVGEANVVNTEHDNDPDKGTTILASNGTTSQSRPLGESESRGPGQTSSLGESTSTNLAPQNPTTSTNYQPTSARSGGITDSADTTFSTAQPTTDSSTVGRNAGIAGGLASAGAGGAAYAASRNNDNTNTLESTDNARAHAMTSGAGVGHINPIAAPEANLRETTTPSARDSQLRSSHAGVLGSSEPSTGLLAGGVRNDDHDVTQLNQAPADVQGATFLDRSYYIGKSGDAVDHGPNVAGQFPPGESISTASSLPATAATGAGVGAVGAGAIGTGSALGGHHSSSAMDTNANPGIQTTTNTSQRLSASARHGSISGIDHNPDSSTTHHSGRDAATVGGAGVAGVAGAGAAYVATRESDSTTHGAYGAEDPNKHNKLHKSSPEDKKLDKEHAKEEKQHQKEVEKHQHELEKEQEKKQRELEKEQEKKQRELEKQHEKDEKERRHAAEKAEKKHEKELEKEEKEKKPGLISRILHRHKDDKDDETKAATELQENKDNGPLDHPLITAAGTTTAVGAAGAAGAYASRDSASGERGTAIDQTRHDGTRGATEVKENRDNGPLDHPLVTAAGGATTAAGAAGTYASRDSVPGESGNFTGQRQHDVEPALSGNNNTIGGPVSTTTHHPTTTLPTEGTTTTSSSTGAQYAAASGGALGAAAGAGALASSSAATTERDTGLTGQRQHDVEPLLSGDSNAIGGSGTTATTATSSTHPPTSSNQYSSKFSENTELGGAAGAIAAPVVIIAGSTTTGDFSRVRDPSSSSAPATATATATAGPRTDEKAGSHAHVPGEGMTGRRQDDVDPYISGGGFNTSSSK
ncbi:hypothetical protein CERZMDRAFT_108056 [Cercospora zeae-maydis SCOH1-5]|uniref:Uncharacterized protein n=1 Tax=Cercospora zeae-maydis SCOH1-5 TaxID=717836 RepID=A0A6A6EZI5_9PEZI|nr:hypothetical protein CERZMDRAFT_108056 [Cercospora zeae-maydis SCOH1-5]